MKWRKMGLIFSPDKNYEWMLSHAANPVAEHINGDIFRIYFSCRDRLNRSSIAFLEIDIKQPQKIIKLSNEPMLSYGSLGAFDDSGVSLGCIVNHSNRKYMYYLGWHLGVTVPFTNTIGLAISDIEEINFNRFSKAPIVDRDDVDPYSISYPYVIKEGSIWKMWYGSHLEWDNERIDRDYGMYHLIKYAESEDGIEWNKKNIICIKPKADEEYAFSKPSVIKENGIYKMWYSYRGKKYRIGYAESENGIDWLRKDEIVGIETSEDGWDSEMIDYPFVFIHKGKKYMLYSGNGYGKSGFGMAVLEEE